jgi:L-fuconolactonase
MRTAYRINQALASHQGQASDQVRGGALVTEIVDPHVHFWNLDANPWYPVLARVMPAVARTYLAPEYRADTAGFAIGGIVHVSATTEPRAFLAEARWLEAMRSPAWPSATIATIEPDSPWDVIEADLAELRKSTLHRGIRVLSGLDPSSDTAGALMRRLAADGLVYDLVVHPDQAPAWRALLDTVPGLVVAVEHAGWPRTAGSFREWQRAMELLAARPRTYCKISGLAMPLRSVALDVQRPWIETCLSAFGAQRCMFASNFPVDAMFGSFAELYGTYQSVAAQLPEEDQRALFAGTARTVYSV